MAILIYATPTSLDGYIADETGNPVGRRRTRRDLLSSTIFSAPSACISMDARCMRRWRFGRHQTSFLV